MLRHCEPTGRRKGPPEAQQSNRQRQDFREFEIPATSLPLPSSASRASFRRFRLASFFQVIEIGQLGLDLGKVQGIGHALRSLLGGPIGFLKAVGGTN